MSDAYQIEGVTITPQGGGYYELSHPSLSAPIRERGKEHAEAKAEEIGKSAATQDNTSMSGALDTSALAAGGDVTGAIPPAPPAPPVENDELAQLKAQLAESEAARIRAEGEADSHKSKADELEKQMATRTVKTDGGEPVPAPGKVSAAVPRKFDGVLDDAAKAELKRLGIETTEIVLEENENIPPTGLFVGHNGRGYMIVPGEPVTVPNFILGVLNDAQMAAPVTDSKSLKVVGYRNRMRYPYRRV